MALLALSATSAQADELVDDYQQTDVVVLDLRGGDSATRSPSQAAFVDGLSAHGELRLSQDAELASILGRRPYSAALEKGRDTLSAAILAFGALDCVTATERIKAAVLDLAAADAAGAGANAELRQAYLYQFLCADRQGNYDEALATSSLLRALIKDERPTEISADTWDKYPMLDALSNQRQVSVTIGSEPSGAEIWIDHRQVGTTPSTLLLGEGTHLVALGLEGRGASQEIKVTGQGKMSLPLAKPNSSWEGIHKALAKVKDASSARRAAAMGDLLAATLADAAFVMREPGRVAVWILPRSRRSAELIGHAPNAKIAGELALQGLEDSAHGAGLDPNMPLLRESDMTTTTARSTRRWWVYGVVLGAAALGAGLIVAQDLSKDEQRIEVTLP